MNTKTLINIIFTLCICFTVACETKKTGNTAELKSTSKPTIDEDDIAPGLIYRQPGYPTSGDLHLAVGNGNIEEIERLISEEGEDVNAKDVFGYAPFHYVKDVATAKFLHSQKAKMDVKSDSGDTPLDIAVKACNVELVEFFINQSVDIHSVQGGDVTPLHKVFPDCIAVAKLLLENGVRPDVKDYIIGRSAFDIAEKEGYQEFLELFKAYM